MILIINLFYVQIIKTDDYQIKLEKLTNNTIEGSTAPRGRIYDRFGKIIVDNKPNKVITYKKDGLTIKEEIEVKETLEVSVLPVEAKVETSAPRKVVENVQVEMILESKEEVKSYKKKERKNKAKKDIKGTFKLFSKWFFKVYDG
jgi:cell division protein FtsI/penicillin-binding protein 2